MADKKEKTSLDKIVEALHPEKITKQIIVPHRKIKTSWKIDNPQIEKYGEFTKHITGYMQHHWKGWYGGKLGDDEAFGHAHALLDGLFETEAKKHNLESGYEYAFKLSREGKLDEVISTLAAHLEHDAQRKYVTSKMKSHINPDDLPAQTALVAEIMDKYKTFLPEGMKLRKPEFYAKNHEQFVQTYLSTIQHAGETMAEKHKKEKK